MTRALTGVPHATSFSIAILSALGNGRHAADTSTYSTLSLLLRSVAVPPKPEVFPATRPHISAFARCASSCPSVR